MFSLVVMLVLILIAAALLIKWSVTIDDEKYTIGLFAIIPPILLVVIGFFSFTSRVEAKQVGVLSAFGKPSDKTYDAGLAWHMPWQEMTQIDATTQTDEYHGDSAIKVILSDKNTADVSATIRWAVNRENANEVYADFRSDDPTDSLRKAVVSTQFKAAINSVFNSYDATAEKPLTPEELSSKVEEIMKGKTDELVDIKSITISYIKPDAAVQKKIDALQTQRGATKVAEEKKKTAILEAESNKILSGSVSNDPNVLVNKCLDLLGDGAFTAPAGFTCWPGQNGSVVIPSGK